MTSLQGKVRESQYIQCALTISWHEFEFVDKLNGGNQESQSFTTSCFSCCQYISVGQKWAHIPNINITIKCENYCTTETLPSLMRCRLTSLPAGGVWSCAGSQSWFQSPFLSLPSVYSHWPLLPKMQMTCPQTHLRKTAVRKTNPSYQLPIHVYGKNKVSQLQTCTVIYI